VPVRVRNIPGGANVNGASQAWGSIPSVVDSAEVDDVLTRRFFLVDALSGIRAGAEEEALPSLVRFASAMRLTVRVQEANPSRLFPPVLDVSYSEAFVGVGGATQVSASFEVTYSMQLVQYWTTVTILIVFACVFVFCGFLYSAFAWMRRNQRTLLDGEFMAHAFVQLLRCYAEVFVWLLFALCGHWYVFFKGQSQSFIMLPEEEDTGPLQVMLILALVAKAVHVAEILWTQGHADVFLVDWETSHGALVGKSGEPSDQTPVSAWRTILVANELNELQAQRMTKPALTLVIVLFFMVGLDFERFAQAVPGDGSRASEYTDSHVLLRFAVSSFVWLIVLVGQQLVLRFFYLPYVEDKVGQFVDLLSVANVSCLILPEKFSGYYLHGRSVHAHADTSMLELNRQLRQEEEGVTSHRGLSPVSEVQSFAVFLTAGMRDLYDTRFRNPALAEQGVEAGRVRTNAANPTNAPVNGLSVARARRAGDGFRSSPEEAVARYSEMSTLLRDWIDSNLEGHNYSIREKTYLEKLIRMPPDMSFALDSVFLFDPEGSGSWTRSLLYGREYDLSVFEVLIYSVADLSLKSSYLAAAITFLTWLVVQWIRSALGQSNLAKKTIIDDRFLI